MSGLLLLLLAAAAAATAVYVLAPLVRRPRPDVQAQRDGGLVAERERHVRALREMELDFRTGKMSAEDYEALRRRHEAAAIAAMRALERQAGASARSVSPGGESGADGAGRGLAGG